MAIEREIKFKVPAEYANKFKELVAQGSRTGGLDLLTKHCNHQELDDEIANSVSHHLTEKILKQTGLVNETYSLNCPKCKIEHKIKLSEFSN